MEEIKFNGNKLLRIRKSRDMSQEKLADLVGVTRQTIYLWESNQNLPDVEKIGKLCIVLNITLPELMDGMNIQYNEESYSKTSIYSKKKRINKKIVILILLVFLIVLMLIYISISMIKFFTLKDIISKWEKLDEINNYYFSYTEIDTDEKGLFNKEAQSYEKYLNDNIMTTVYRNPETHDISFVMIDNYDTNERIVTNEKEKTFKRSSVDIGTTSLSTHLPNTIKFFSFDNKSIFEASFNPNFIIRKKGNYTIEKDSLITILNKETGLIFYEEYIDNNSKTQNYVKEFSIETNTDKTFEIDLSEYAEVE